MAADSSQCNVRRHAWWSSNLLVFVRIICSVAGDDILTAVIAFTIRRQFDLGSQLATDSSPGSIWVGLQYRRSTVRWRRSPTSTI